MLHDLLLCSTVVMALVYLLCTHATHAFIITRGNNKMSAPMTKARVACLASPKLDSRRVDTPCTRTVVRLQTGRAKC